jgi:hypothetical protein
LSKRQRVIVLSDNFPHGSLPLAFPLEAYGAVSPSLTR